MNYTKEDIRQANKSQYYKNKLYLPIDYSESDIYIITTIGDRLDLLANQYYGDVELWKIIALANNNISNDSIFVQPGTQIRIPINVNEIINSFKNQQ